MPHLPDVGVLALVPERFGVQWTSRQQVLTRLGRYYNVLWMNPAQPWRESRNSGPLIPSGAAPDAGLAFEVHPPEPWLPLFYSPAWLDRLTDTARLRNARRRLVGLGARRIVLHLWRPSFAPAFDRVAYDFGLYHMVDEYSFSDRDMPISERERACLERSDGVIIHSPGLMEKKGALNPATVQIPNGVDFAAVTAPGPEPEDLVDIPHPRIGYCGRLMRQLDWDLIGALAERHPQWSFVFAGGAAPHPDVEAVLGTLGARPNVHLLGTKQTRELVRYPRHFDVCMMPYRITAYTNCIDPLNLHEYLASGRPVVGTGIRTLRDFENVVQIASGVDAWTAAIGSSLAEAPESASPRIEVARRHDWDRIAHRVAAVMARGLASELKAASMRSRFPRRCPTRGRCRRTERFAYSWKPAPSPMSPSRALDRRRFNASVAAPV